VLAAIPLAVSAPQNLLDGVTFVLAACALAAVLGAAKWEGAIDVSGAFVCFILAAVFLGPAAVFVIVVVTELVTWVGASRGWLGRRPYRAQVLPINLAALAVPALLAAFAFDALAGTMGNRPADVAALAVVEVGFLALNFVVLRSLMALLDGHDMRKMLSPPRELLPSLALTVALTLALAGVYTEFGTAASAFVVLILVGFAYMARLVVVARERTAQYASLSWGVLSSLVRSLDRRDRRTARHSAAVAAFARDIALECGMSKRDAELAHTAGLLHDIGRFALPDRVMERHGTLINDDWDAIHQHPELGAELLRDLGVYGPVAQIVRAHHERIDGRGYPDGLNGDEIPEIARIVAVAEVYDTLTAEDTYRDRMTSFQAMTELRRVAGRQLDERFVEALASLLAGRGLEYRHADAADFDTELAIEGRIADSVATDSATGSGGSGAVAGEPASQ
ncbi:MAG TPA: HD domain-containing phosphohydrolase, partial [Solirubrobacteraceae bacterium]|nr:HD domain-containing phosphohydrolase [Solirubrobacteraceae bacterium]